MYNSPMMDTVSDLLKGSVTDVFRTIFDIEAHPVPFKEIRHKDEALVAGSVGFVGEVNGLVYAYFNGGFARTLASRLLALPEHDISDEMVDDVVGELSNMFVGSTKSCLCDIGFSCKLSTPSVVRGHHLRTQALRGSELFPMTIMCGDEPILLELILTPAQ